MAEEALRTFTHSQCTQSTNNKRISTFQDAILRHHLNAAACRGRANYNVTYCWVAWANLNKLLIIFYLIWRIKETCNKSCEVNVAKWKVQYFLKIILVVDVIDENKQRWRNSQCSSQPSMKYISITLTK